jgi:hypothetical protein
MAQRYPREETPETLEGTAAHWVFAKMLDGAAVAAGMQAPNGAIVTEEMLEGGELVVDVVRSRFGPTHSMLVESPIGCERIDARCWGTPDIWGFDDPTLVLEVIDYKFGHRFVDEYDNYQGVTYVAGILDHLAAVRNLPSGQFDQMVRVNFTIVQPRCFYRGAPIRTWSFMGSDIRAHVNQLQAAAAKALGPNPEAVTNEACRDCPGRHACVALQKAAYSDAEFAVVSVPVELSPVAADLELRMLERAADRLQARLEGLRETCVANAKRGHALPYHRLVQGYGRQQWTLPPEQVVAIGQLYGVDLAKPSVMTPKQAAKLGIDESVIKQYSLTPLGKLNLEPDNPADARRVFGANM